jgi:DNA-binding IclR family transcriptional regulator
MAMERDDKILSVLAEGPAGSTEVAARTGLPLSTVKRALRHLLAADYVFAAGWGTYRLTDRGRAVSPAAAVPSPQGKAAAGSSGAPTPAKRRLDLTI